MQFQSTWNLYKLPQLLPSYSEHYTWATIEFYATSSMACDLAISTYPWHPRTYPLSLNYPQEVKLPAIATIQYRNSLI